MPITKTKLSGLLLHVLLLDVDTVKIHVVEIRYWDVTSLLSPASSISSSASEMTEMLWCVCVCVCVCVQYTLLLVAVLVAQVVFSVLMAVYREQVSQSVRQLASHNYRYYFLSSLPLALHALACRCWYNNPAWFQHSPPILYLCTPNLTTVITFI